MDAISPTSDIPKFGPLTKGAIIIASADEAALRLSPPHDVSNVRAIGALLLSVGLYQASVLAIVGNELLVTDDHIHPTIIAGAALIAILVMQIDSYAFLRAGYHLDGLKELARGGLDLRGGIGAQLQAGMFLILRLALSVGFAGLCGIFMGLIIFHADITAEIDRLFQQQNAALISTATSQVDSEIQRTTDIAKDDGAHVAALQKQVLAMRDGTVNPADSSVAVQAELQEIAQLLVVKRKRDDELKTAEDFATNELAGIKGDQTNSGVPGRGPIRIAAEERVKTATANAAAASQALAEARARLDELRKQTASTSGEKSRQAQLLLPQLESDLQTATAQLATAQDNLANLTSHREDIIRARIYSAPDRVGRNAGLLAQLSALRRLADDPEILAVILLIDLTSFGLELAAVLAKVTSYVPTTYAALLARDAYMNAVAIVDEMDAALRRRPPEPEEDTEFLRPIFPAGGGGNQAAAESGPINGETFPFGETPSTATTDIESVPAKRPRGRPRKYAIN